MDWIDGETVIDADATERRDVKHWTRRKSDNQTMGVLLFAVSLCWFVLGMFVGMWIGQ